MPTYEDLVELAKICTRQARAAADKSVATVLLEMAKEYQAEAVKIRQQQITQVGEPLLFF